jgi:hypothetical protein
MAVVVYNILERPDPVTLYIQEQGAGELAGPPRKVEQQQQQQSVVMSALMCSSRSKQERAGLELNDTGNSE